MRGYKKMRFRMAKFGKDTHKIRDRGNETLRNPKDRLRSPRSGGHLSVNSGCPRKERVAPFPPSAPFCSDSCPKSAFQQSAHPLYGFCIWSFSAPKPEAGTPTQKPYFGMSFTTQCHLKNMTYCTFQQLFLYLPHPSHQKLLWIECVPPNFI